MGNSNSNCTCINDKLSKSQSQSAQRDTVMCPTLQSSLCENRQTCIFYLLYLQCKENQNLSIQSISVSNSQDISISNSQCASVSLIWYHYLLLYLFTLLGIRPQSLSTISYEIMQIFYSLCLQATWSLVSQSQQLNPKL